MAKSRTHVVFDFFFFFLLSLRHCNSKQMSAAFIRRKQTIETKQNETNKNKTDPKRMICARKYRRAGHRVALAERLSPPDRHRLAGRYILSIRLDRSTKCDTLSLAFRALFTIGNCSHFPLPCRLSLKSRIGADAVRDECRREHRVRRRPRRHRRGHYRRRQGRGIDRQCDERTTDG